MYPYRRDVSLGYRNVYSAGDGGVAQLSKRSDRIQYIGRNTAFLDDIREHGTRQLVLTPSLSHYYYHNHLGQIAGNCSVFGNGRHGYVERDWIVQ